jgi:hypothetical protein
MLAAANTPMVYAVGISNVYNGTTLVAYGHAEGPANPFHDTQSTLAPEAQVGYFGRFADSSWLWGVKFQYKYLGITSTDRDLLFLRLERSHLQVPLPQVL